jgi:hypothetical protein
MTFLNGILKRPKKLKEKMFTLAFPIQQSKASPVLLSLLLVKIEASQPNTTSASS